MPWFKVDDQFFAHQKVLALRTSSLEDTAIALWTKAGSWSMSKLTDGEVPAYVVETLVRKNAIKAADELVRVGLWEKTDEGYRFRSWDEYQPSKEKVVTDRKKNADKIADWRAKNPKPKRNQVTPSEVTPPPYPYPYPSSPDGEVHAPPPQDRRSPVKAQDASLDPRNAEVLDAYRDGLARSNGGKRPPVTTPGRFVAADRIRVALTDVVPGASWADQLEMVRAAAAVAYADPDHRKASAPISQFAAKLEAYVSRSSAAPGAPTGPSRIDEISAAMAACEAERQRTEPGPERDALRRRYFKLQAELRAVQGAA